MAQAGIGSIRREEEVQVPMVAGSDELSLPGLLGIVTCSMAITLAVREPPPGLDKTTYLLAIAGTFFAGVAGVVAAAVCASNNNPRTRRAAGRKLVRASVGPLAVIIGLSAASLLLW
ncbi:unnamed protein product [Urochloa humidicola]